MNKYTVITIRIFLVLTVVFALYLYYPYAYRIFTNLINLEWHSTSESLTGPHQRYEFLRIMLNLGVFIVGFIVLPGILLFYMWKLTNKIKSDTTQTRKTRRGSHGRKHQTTPGVDEILLLHAYNQLQHIEESIDAKLAKIKEELVTELRGEIDSMFARKAEAEDCLEKARTLYKSGNYEEACAVSSTAVELSPFGVAYYVRGAVHHKLGLDEAAMDDLITAAKLGYQKAQDFLATKGVSYS